MRNFIERTLKAKVFDLRIKEDSVEWWTWQSVDLDGLNQIKDEYNTSNITIMPRLNNNGGEPQPCFKFVMRED